MEIKYQSTKTLKCRDNNRSSDFITPNFINGCLDWSCSYCYANRWNDNIYINQNIDEILSSCDDWVSDKIFPKPENQVGKTYYYGDICCNTDLNRMWKYYDWFYVFDYFKQHPKLKATFATKFVNHRLLEYDPEQNVRVRMSLIPQRVANILEHGTSPITKRIRFIEKLYKSNYEVHANFSPVVLYKGWEADYIKLFQELKQLPNEAFNQIKLEVIFLTHEVNKHERNLLNGWDKAEKVLWTPKIQETKQSQYGGTNLRYKAYFKKQKIEIFKQLVKDELGLPIRYIF